METFSDLFSSAAERLGLYVLQRLFRTPSTYFHSLSTYLHSRSTSTIHPLFLLFMSRGVSCLRLLLPLPDVASMRLLA
jgi:hypothetical protein